MTNNTAPKLRAVAEAILRHPDHFNMSTFFDNPPCGTTACIAGWAITLAANKDMPEMSLESLGHDAAHAMQILEIDAQEQARLFHVSRWPKEFREKYADRFLDDDAAQVAVERIYHFIETKGAE